MKNIIHYSFVSRANEQTEWGLTICGIKNADRLILTDRVKHTTCKRCIKSLSRKS